MVKKTIDLLKNDPFVSKALQQIKDEEQRMLEEQKYLCAIAAPSNQEEERSLAYYEMFSKLNFDKVWRDDVNNVFGLMKGTGDGSTIILSAHMDTVFDLDTDVKLQVDEDGIIRAPGIGDDTRGMVEVLAIARAMLKNNVRPQSDIIFCGDVGEESAGNLRGVRHIFATQKNIDAFISIDGSRTETLNINAVASRKLKITYTGTGGHALGMFGYPNANLALGRCIARIADLEVPKEPLTVFNVGLLNGGTSINAIPIEATAMIDIRSLSEEILDILEYQIRQAADEGCRLENKRWNHATEKVEYSVEKIAQRPGGLQSKDKPIVHAAIEEYEAFGLEANIPPGASTDANLPISLGIPAIAVGCGGTLKYAHTIREEYNPENGTIGPQRNIIILLLMGGYQDICVPIV